MASGDVLSPERRDEDNVWKCVLDALVQARLLVDDSAGWVQIGTVAYIDGKERATTITLEDLDPLTNHGGRHGMNLFRQSLIVAGKAWGVAETLSDGVERLVIDCDDRCYFTKKEALAWKRKFAEAGKAVRVCKVNVKVEESTP